MQKKQKLILQTCCAPCFTGSFEQIKDGFDVTSFWCNPNIYPEEEYFKRLGELKKYTDVVGVRLILGDKYREDHLFWSNLTKNYAAGKEGGRRCAVCIKYRLLKAAEYAENNGFDYFATTLSISPHKDTEMINQIGKEIEKHFKKAKFLEVDFKNQYKRSIEICKENKIYRQKYCGCGWSLRSNC